MGVTCAQSLLAIFFLSAWVDYEKLSFFLLYHIFLNSPRLSLDFEDFKSKGFEEPLQKRPALAAFFLVAFIENAAIEWL